MNQKGSDTKVSLEELMLITGRVDHITAFTDAMLFSAFRVLTLLKPKTAAAIFYTVDSFHGRAELLRRVAEVEGDGADKELVKKLIAAGEKANNQRRELAHGMVSGLDEKTPMEYFKPKSRKATQVTKGWLDQHSNNAGDAMGEAHQVFAILCTKHNVPVEIDFG
jgi:hypothetical protein